MKLLAIVLVALIALIQFPLWLGKGSWPRVWAVERKIAMQRETNERLTRRNEALDAEVRDLKEGLAAVEERARSELGMVKQDEIFFEVLQAAPGTAPRGTAPRR
jgi:cell division protein FtsB